MTHRYKDEDSYQFHELDRADRCFLCASSPKRLLVVRRIKGMQLVHLCRDCMLDHLSEYLLDNTRPWLSEKIKNST